ncbi:MAG: hypothetical protein U0457_07990 [Candidatus Sericytochromatia bacterium]
MLKKILLPLVLVSSISFSAQAGNDFEINPGKNVGKITAKTTYKDLEKLYGAKNLKNKKERFIPDSDETTDITYVHENKPEELKVLWRDKKLLYVVITNKKSKYKTKEGIKVGSTMSEVTKANGKAFDFSGFAWDFGGRVTNWNKGKLDAYKGKISFVFDYESKTNPETKFLGDITLKSDAKGLDKMKPFVHELEVFLD